MVESLNNNFNVGKLIQRKLYNTASGVSDFSYDVIKRAIVVNVNRTITDDPFFSQRIPVYSVQAAIIGEDQQDFNIDPKLSLYGWFKPLMSIHNISIPEIGEEILVINENTSKKSSGYWISRINDSSLVSGFLTRNNIQNLSNKLKYGFNFDVSEINYNNSHIQPSLTKKVYAIPAFLGDVISQGRSGTYIRHSFDPNSNYKIGVLEMGLMEDRKYLNSDNLATIGKTRTKTIHMRGRISDITNLRKKTLVDIEVVGPFPDGSYQNIPTNISSTPKNFIANLAEEFYNISTSNKRRNLLYREVLGEELEEYQNQLNQKINELIVSINSFVDITTDFLQEFLRHTHVLPEINIEIPDKEISFVDQVRKPDRLIPQGTRDVTIKGSSFTTTIQTQGGLQDVRRNIPDRIIKVKNPPKLIRGGVKNIIRKKKISYDTITIGGEGNKRITTTPETTVGTANITDNLIDLVNRFEENSNNILLLSNETRKFLSKTHFIN